MIRKIIYSLMLVMLSSVTIWGQTTCVRDGVTYELIGTTAKLWSGDGNKYKNNYGGKLTGNITIPYEIIEGGQTYKVDFSGDGVFENCTNLGEIYIDSENVPNSSFKNAHFTKLTFGPHVKTVGDEVFANANFGNGSYKKFNLIFDSKLESSIALNFLTNLGNNVEISVIFNETPLPSIESDQWGNSFFKELDKYGNNKGAIVVPDGATLPDSWIGNVPAGVTVTDPTGHVYNPATGEIKPGVIYDPETGEVVPGDVPSSSFEIVDTDPSTYPTKGGRGDVSYSRSFSNTSWQALFVPFTMKCSKWLEAGLRVAKIKNIHRYDSNGDGTNDSWLLELKTLGETDDVVANYPYLIMASTAGNTNVTDNNCAISKPSTSNEVTCWSTEMKYTFVTVMADFNQWSQARDHNSKVYVLSGGQLKEVVAADGKSTLRAFRWYMKATPTDPDGQMSTDNPSSARIRTHVNNDADCDDSKTFFTTDGINIECFSE